MGSGPVPSSSSSCALPREPVITLSADDIVSDEETGFVIVLGAPVEEEPPDPFAGRRHELELVIAAYAAEQPVPAPPRPCLEVAVTNALVDLGRESCPEKVRVVSNEHLLRFAAQLPHAAAALTRLEAGAAAMLLGQLAETAGDALSAALDQRLSDAIGHDACVDLAALIARRIIAPLVRRPRSFLVDQFGERLWRSYQDILRLHLGLTFAGRERDAAVVAPFLEMFRNGNFPVGTLTDGTFLVVTA